jgi:autotransporter-associated beta strand protein
MRAIACSGSESFGHGEGKPVGTTILRVPTTGGARWRLPASLKVIPVIVVALLVLLALAGTASAATFTWDGGGTNSLWSTKENWVGDVAPPTSGATTAVFVFDASTYPAKMANTYDLAITSCASIIFTGEGWKVSSSAPSTKNSPTGVFVVNSGATVDWGVRFAVAADRTLTNNGEALTLSNAPAGSDAIVLSSGKYLTIDGTGATTISGRISGAGGLTKSGSGALTLSWTGASHAYTGTTTVSEGSLTMDGGWSPASNATVTISTGSKVEMAVWGAISGSGGVIKQGLGDLSLNGAFSYTGTTTVSAGTLTAAGALTNASRSFSVASGATATLSGPISGTSALTKDDGGTLRLTNANTYSGATTLTAGTLNMVVPEGTSPTLPSVISGAGALTKSGLGSLTLTGINTYTGQTTVSAGTLSAQGALDTSNGTRVISVGDSGAATYSGVISGTGGLTKQGGGTLTLGATNTFTGGLTVNAGAVRSIAGWNTTSSHLVTVADNGEATLGAVSGSGSLEKAGAGTLTLTGTNSYGNTTVSNGTLIATDVSSLPGYNGAGGRTLTVNANATLGVQAGLIWTKDEIDKLLTHVSWGNTSYLAFDTTNAEAGSFVYPTDLGATPTIGITKLGEGTLVMSGSNTYPGRTLVSRGTLEVANPAALPGYKSLTHTPPIFVYGGATLAVDASAWDTADIDTLVDTVEAGGGWSDQSFLGIDTGKVPAGFVYSTTGIDGSMGLSKIGDYELQITQPLRYGGTAGQTKVTGGTLKLAVQEALPPTTTVTISSGATLDVNNVKQTIGPFAGSGFIKLGDAEPATGQLISKFSSSGDYTYNGVISGTGSVERGQNGADEGSTLTLTNDNSYTGPTILSGGVLRINNQYNIGHNPGSYDDDHLLFKSGTLECYGDVTLDDSNRGVTMGAGGGTIQVDLNPLGATPYLVVLQDVVHGSGTLSKTGGGTQRLTGDNSQTFNGSVWLLGGMLEIDSADELGGDPGSSSSGQLTIDNAIDYASVLHVTGNVNIPWNNSGVTVATHGGVINVEDGCTMTVPGPFTGAGQLDLIGPGELVAAGAGNYSGTANVNDGVLRMNGSFDPACTVNVAAGAALAGTGDAGGSVGLSGDILPGDDGAVGTLSSGGQRWDGKGRYVVNMNSATTDPWAGHDLLQIDGDLAINSTNDAPFIVSVVSTATNFDNTKNARWHIAHVTGSIQNFDFLNLDLEYSGINIGTGKLRLETATGGSEFLDLVYYAKSTDVTVTSFRAYRHNGHVIPTWKTASLGDTLGFNLYRKSRVTGRWVKVNHRMIPALFESQSGGKYSVIDRKAPLHKRSLYRLDELQKSAPTRHYKYRVLPRPMPKGLGVPVPLPDALAARQGSVTGPSNAGTTATQQPTTVTPPVGAAVPGGRVRIEVAASGLYALRAPDIATALGMRPAAVSRLIRAGRLALTNQGHAVAVMGAADASALYFYGESLATPYASKNVYFLARGRAVRLQSASTPVPDTPATTFVDTLHVEKDLMAMTGLYHDPEADFWIWDYLVAGDPDYGLLKFTLNAPSVVAGRTLSLSLLGMSATGTSNEHHVKVKLNGVALGDVKFSGITEKTAGFAIPDGVLTSGQNEVQVQSLNDSGAAYSIVGVDSFDLSYTRRAVAVDDQLQLEAGARGMRVDGLSTRPVWVFDVSAPLRPTRLRARTSGDAGAVRADFTTTAGGRYAVSTGAGAMSPLSMVGVSAVGSSMAAGGADYLAICPPELQGALGELTAYRRAQGLSTAVVSPQQIYDDFSFGLTSPQAVKQFITSTLANWHPAPRFVLFAGEGSFDYRDSAGYGDCRVPPLLIDSTNGLVPSDGLLADANGDGAPDVALGRIPAATPAALTAYIQKVKRYEASSGAWRTKVLFTADNADTGGAFGADSDTLATLVPGGYTVTKAYLGSVSLSAARSSLKTAFNQGSLVVNFLGHGGYDRVTSEGLLVSDDVPSLAGAGKEPVFVGMTCNAGNFAVPGSDCLSEKLVLKGDGGAIGVLAPTTMVMNFESRSLDSRFLPALFSAERPTLGAAWHTALAAYGAAGRDRTALASYELFGDPALEVFP